MIIMLAMDAALIPRLVARSLADRLRVMPAVVVTGARQTGKSTLVQALAPGGRRYVSLDDLDPWTRRAAIQRSSSAVTSR